MKPQEKGDLRMKSGSSPEITIIIVSWNVQELIVNCIKSIFEKTRENKFELIVVDNYSTDMSVKVVKSVFPQVTVIENSSNVGYSRAINSAILKSSGEYILILNPDTVIADDICKIFINFMKMNLNVGAVGGKAILPNGSIDYCSARNLPSMLSQIFELTYLSKIWPQNRILGRYDMKYWDHNSARKVEFLSGQLIMIRRKVIDNIGPLDENFFLYYEDADLCRRVLRAGWDIQYLPEATIIHYESQSVKGHPARKELYLEMFRSMLKYHKKHEGAIAATALRILIFVSYSIRALLSWCMYLFSSGSSNIEWEKRRRLYSSVVKWSCDLKSFNY
jgi:GT2 family glycosyltransferase